MRQHPTDSSEPVMVTDVTGVTRVTNGDFLTCAALTGGTALGWGNNAGCQLCDGTTTAAPALVTVSGLP